MNKITTENLGTPSNYLTIRCPDCLKMYMVNEDQIKTVYPEFTCNNCKCLFAFEYPVPKRDSVITFKVLPTIFDFKKKCPKCDFMQSEKNETCSACGVVIENFLLIKNETYPKVSLDLVKQWNGILKEFENEYLHELFIKNCLIKNNIEYAEFKYKELARRAGDESMVSPWLGKINHQKFESKQTEKKEKKFDEPLKTSESISQDSWPRAAHQALNFITYMAKNNWFYLLGTLAGLLLIVMGISTLGKRNQIGLGIALVVSSLGFYVFRTNNNQGK